MAQITMIYTNIGIGIANSTIFNIVGRRIGYWTGILGGDRFALFFSIGERIYIIFRTIYFAGMKPYPILPTANFIRLNRIQSKHLIDRALHCEGAFGCIA